jgi:hypothetical protein
MSAKIFISYRREDGAAAGRVHDRLASEFGSDLLFMDVDAIPLGANFIKVLRRFQFSQERDRLPMKRPEGLDDHATA